MRCGTFSNKVAAPGLSLSLSSSLQTAQFLVFLTVLLHAHHKKKHFSFLSSFIAQTLMSFYNSLNFLRIARRVLMVSSQRSVCLKEIPRRNMIIFFSIQNLACRVLQIFRACGFWGCFNHSGCFTLL